MDRWHRLYDDHDVIQAAVYPASGYWAAKVRESSSLKIYEQQFIDLEEAKAWCLAIARMG
jgi:hypothetical protein